MKKLHQYEVMCIGLLFAVFGIVAWRVHAGGVTVMDTYVRGVVKGLQTESSLTFFSHYTKLGSAIGIVTVLIISLLVFGENVIIFAMIVYPMGILTTHLVNKGIKEIMKRDRPSLNETLDALGYSFLVGMQCYLL